MSPMGNGGEMNTGELKIPPGVPGMGAVMPATRVPLVGVKSMSMDWLVIAPVGAGGQNMAGGMGA